MGVWPKLNDIPNGGEILAANPSFQSVAQSATFRAPSICFGRQVSIEPKHGGAARAAEELSGKTAKLKSCCGI